MSRYENYEIKNNIFGTLSAPISSLATTIQLGDGQGQRFSENMLATLENIENGKVMKREIVLITAINGDALTVERKYAPCPANDDANTQGKVSFNFSTDDIISAYITKEHFTQINKAINDLYDNGDDRVVALPTGGLGIRITSGNVRVGNQEFSYAGGTAILTDNATNYVMLDGAGTIQIDTAGRNQQYNKIATIITSGGAITDLYQWKIDSIGGQIGGDAGFKNITSTTYTKGLLTQLIADGQEYNLTYEFGRVKTIQSGQKTYTMTYYNGRLIGVVES